jgi:hypothetical protein
LIKEKDIEKGKEEKIRRGLGEDRGKTKEILKQVQDDNVSSG